MNVQLLPALKTARSLLTNNGQLHVFLIRQCQQAKRAATASQLTTFHQAVTNSERRFWYLR